MTEESLAMLKTVPFASLAGAVVGVVAVLAALAAVVLFAVLAS